MLEIRRTRREDEDSFIRVYRAAYTGLEEYAYKRRREIKWYFRWLLRRDPEGFYLAEDRDQTELPVGFIACDTNWISPFEGRTVNEIHELIVHPEWMGMGIGRTLLLKGLEYGRSRGEDLAELWVGHENTRARRFYLKMGFEERETIGIWIRMTKRINI